MIGTYNPQLQVAVFNRRDALIAAAAGSGEKDTGDLKGGREQAPRPGLQPQRPRPTNVPPQLPLEPVTALRDLAQALSCGNAESKCDGGAALAAADDGGGIGAGEKSASSLAPLLLEVAWNSLPAQLLPRPYE